MRPLQKEVKTEWISHVGWKSIQPDDHGKWSIKAPRISVKVLLNACLNNCPVRGQKLCGPILCFWIKYTEFRFRKNT